MARDSLKNVLRLIEQTDLSVEQSFLADLKRSIEATELKSRRVPSQSYKPSSMKCIRSMYYMVSGIEPDNSPSSYTLIGICNSGTDIHIRIQQAIDDMKSNGIDCEYIDVAKFIEERNIPDLSIVSKSGMETKLHHDKLNMTFMCDGLVKYKNHYYILELKTETSFKWRERKGVNPEHEHQATAYSLSLGVDEVLFVYICRDVLDMKAYLFKPTDEMKAELVGTIESCDEYVNKGIVPPKPENLSKSTCAYCNYKGRCGHE